MKINTKSCVVVSTCVTFFRALLATQTGILVYITSAPIATGGQTPLAFYTHRARTSTMFVKKNVKMHSIVYQIWKKKVHVVFFRFKLYNQRNITIAFTSIHWDSLIAMRNYYNFWKNICQIIYAIFKHLTL